MDLERLKRAAADGDEGALRELSRMRLRRMPTRDAIKAAVADGSLQEAVAAMDSKVEKGLLAMVAKREQARWEHAARLVEAYREQVFSDYIASDMTQTIWALKGRVKCDHVALDGSAHVVMRWQTVLRRTPSAHRKQIWQDREAHIVTTDGIKMALLRGKQQVSALRRVIEEGNQTQGPMADHLSLWSLNRLTDGRPWVTVAGARYIAKNGLSVHPGRTPLTLEQIDTVVARVLITGRAEDG